LSGLASPGRDRVGRARRDARRVVTAYPDPMVDALRPLECGWLTTDFAGLGSSIDT
jgi:hypothetical protein